MRVRHTGDSMRFYVSSADGDGMEYLVDLTENKGLGACTCRDHASRVQPLIDRGAPFKDYPLPGRLQCKHVHKTLLWLGKMVAAKQAGRDVTAIYGQET